MVELIRYMWNIMKPYFVWYRFVPFIFFLYLPITIFTFIPHDIEERAWIWVQWGCLILIGIYLLYVLLFSATDAC